MKLVYICSPLKGDIIGNIEKAKKYCVQAIEQDYIPIAPHVYFTQFLDDNNEEERKKGMQFGIELLKFCDELWVYGKQSEGMKKEIEWWLENKSEETIFYRS